MIKTMPSSVQASGTSPKTATLKIVADTILSRYNDLAPSLKRIMDAGLDEPGRLHAITLFQASLGVTDDPMRNPVNAIAAGRSKEHDSG